MQCREIRARLEELGRMAPETLPTTVRDHLAACTACADALAVRRGVARLLTARLRATPEPPPGFAEAVLARLPARMAPAREPDTWRSAWGLIPAFTAAAVALMILYQTSDPLLPPGLLPIDDLSAGERVVLQDGGGNADLLLSAILEGTR